MDGLELGLEWIGWVFELGSWIDAAQCLKVGEIEITVVLHERADLIAVAVLGGRVEPQRNLNILLGRLETRMSYAEHCIRTLGYYTIHLCVLH